MKNTFKAILLVLLSVIVCMSLIACKKDKETSEVKTSVTLELVSADSENAIVDETALNENETEYYVLSGYSFSTSDAEIIANVARDANYYTDLYCGSRKDTAEYKAEKERYAKLATFTLPAAVKVDNTDSKISLSEEDLAKMNADGVIDLSTSSNAKTVYIRALAESALYGHAELKDITVPDTYLAIGSGAFSGCSSLESITLPFVGQKVGALNGGKVFGYIFGTSEYAGGVSVTQSYNASGSTSYYVPANLTTVTVKQPIGVYAFYNVSTVKTVNYTVEGNAVPDYAFYGCSSMKEVTIPATVTEIGEGSFGNCSSLLSFDFANITKIGASAFINCTKLGYTDKALTLSAVTFVGEKAFSGCSAIETLTVTSSSQVVVKANAFAKMSSLKTLSISKAELSIGAFSSWSNMLEVTASDCTVVGGGELSLAFVGCFEADNGSQKANIKFN